jgi:D-alanyl-lipoteichoic acid acyltransferase DltB (MBOAT superfamily)
MLFNSIDFIIFLPIVFFIYWFITNKNLRLQNVFIVIASYIFYGWWDWRFLFLLFISTAMDYFIGIGLLNTQNVNRRKILLFLSILTNLGLLGFFKYYNFFIDNFIRAFTLFGMEFTSQHLNIILPIGISFYTFQTLSYSIDVYKKRIEPTKDFIAFAAFVAFFPGLVAGPIERAKNLLPQFLNKRVFSYSSAVNGCKQILWGFFKKVVIADTCSIYVDIVFNNYQEYNGIILIIGFFLFLIQVYGDFSGYSDIAIGIAKLFGFTLMQNFAFPFFSRNIPEFWQRWHISLMSWFRDYVFFPLCKKGMGPAGYIRNTFIIYFLSGFWHGAEWTFILFGLINAVYFIPSILFRKLENRKKKKFSTLIVAEGKIFPSLYETYQMISTFVLVSFSTIFFRSDNLSDSFGYISRIFSGSFLSLSDFPGGKNLPLKLLLVILFFIIEWFGRENRFAIENVRLKTPLRWIFYYGILGCIILYSGTPQTFIYFQF